MTGREMELIQRGVVALERVATLIEKGLEEEVVEGASPSECPFCGKQNPVVTELEMGVGPVDEFVLMGETHCCNKKVYAVPVQMMIAPNADVARELTMVKKGGNENGTH